jgi:hypothetical protein
MEVHFKHQKEIQRFHDRRETKLKNLEARRERYSTAFREEFDVDEDIVGLVIGKSGERLRRVQDQYGVEIQVERQEERRGKQNSTKRRVKILGDDKQNVEKAREEIEYQKEYWTIEPDQTGWVLGKRKQNLMDFQTKTGILRLRYLPETNQLELCGLRSHIEDTLLLLESHLQYYNVYSEMDKEQDNLDRSFIELDMSAGYGRKGKG